MKQLIFKTAAIIAVFVMSVSLASCGDDDPTEPTPTNTYTKVEIVYDIDLADTYYELWDVKATYTTPGGNEETVAIEEDHEWILELNTADEIPLVYNLSVVGKPKNPAPELDLDKVYSLNHECSIIAYGYKADGTRETIDMAGVGMAKLSTNGAHLVDAIKKDRKITSQTRTVTIKK